MSFRVRRAALFGALALAGGVLVTVADAQNAAPAPCERPVSHRGNQVDTYNGVTVTDPYRWLEDTDSPETAAWVTAQNCVTHAWLSAIPERAMIRQRLTALWSYERFGVPTRVGGRYVYARNDGLQNQAVLYWQPSLAARARVLIDPNSLSTDGTVALTSSAVSRNGRYLAYGTASGGSDWNEFHVRDITTGRDMADTLRWIKFSGMSWTHDHGGFFYSRYAEPSGAALRSVVRNQKLYYHRLGADQSADPLVYERPDQPDFGFGGQVTEDGRYLAIAVWLGTDSRNRFYYMDLHDAARPGVQGDVVRLLDDFDATYSFVGNDGPVFYFFTNLDAPRGRLIAIDTRHPERAAWREIIPQGEHVLDAVALVGGRFVVSWMEDAHHRLAVYERTGAHVRDIPLPGLGAVGGLSGRPDSPELFYAFTSYLYPTTIFRYDVATGRGAVWRAPHLDFDPAPYETRQVFVTSRDGTRVPMFITARRDLQRDGTNPVYLTAYGGFNISTLPAFSVSNAAWLEMGGVLATPNLRGGGEYGEEWHQAGMLERKQNVFDDFIAAAEYLIAEHYTTPARLAIGGGSNGGLLVGAVLNQRPELFGAALPAVGVMDMLRFHRFTIGWAWVTEYGSADSTGQFPFLYRYSPLHNIRPGAHYPATLVTTADHDDRVVPGHSFKYTAALQAAQGGPAPILIRVETRGGHGAGTPVSKQIEQATDRWAFLSRILGMGRAGT